MFIPATEKEFRGRGWDRADVVLVTGDAYIDSPYIGVSVIGKALINAGFRVGIIPQPLTDSDADISRFGEPLLFWGVTAGSIDSMVANYTASKKRRKSDDYTPGGVNNRRPDRASIAYTNLIRRFYKNSVPIVLGGVEASLRRVAHYDYWSNAVRRSILFDAKADYLIYGMAEKAVLEFADSVKRKKSPLTVRGLCYISKNKPENTSVLPSFEEASESPDEFAKMFRIFYDSQLPKDSITLSQKHGDRYLIHNPPSLDMTTEELDSIYTLPFERDVHPFNKKEGNVKALETIGASITTHRGCSGECAFCSISLHQGRKVISRSEKSILSEAKSIASHSSFKGVIHDAGGPTANMYGVRCGRTEGGDPCGKRSCLHPSVCKHLVMNHKGQMDLLKKINGIDGVNKVFLASGLRHDMVISDKKEGKDYINRLARNHVSGQLKLAPEHTENSVLKLMGKPGISSLLEFKTIFDKCSMNAGKKQFLTYYFIAAHPGCSENEMKKMKDTVSRELKINPEQVQIFIPLPSTWSAVMYHTGKDPFTGKTLFVEKDIRKKEAQKNILTDKGSGKR